MCHKKGEIKAFPNKNLENSSLKESLNVNSNPHEKKSAIKVYYVLVKGTYIYIFLLLSL